MLGKAVEIAAKVHSAQKDKGGNAYILHPMRMMMRLRTDDKELMIIAILHDVVEDSDWTVEALQKEGFSERVLVALILLTHNRSEAYESYIKKIATNADATRIKLEDLRDNSDITRLKGLRPKDIQRVEKYHKAYTFLKTTLKNMEHVGY